jgi:hypothetical protein
LTVAALKYATHEINALSEFERLNAWTLRNADIPYTNTNTRTQYQIKAKHLSICVQLELIQTQMAQKPMLRAEVGMRVRCANKASAE